MSTISILSRLVSGAQRQVDLSTNTLLVGALQITSGGNILSNAILGNLINLQNGSDFANGTNSHTHDGRYFTETELGSVTGGSAGSTLIGDDNSYSNFTPTAATVKGALQGIDTALGSVGGFANQTLSNLTSPTAINQDLLPGVTDSINLGSALKEFLNLYTQNVIASALVQVDKISLNSAYASYWLGSVPAILFDNAAANNIIQSKDTVSDGESSASLSFVTGAIQSATSTGSTGSIDLRTGDNLGTADSGSMEISTGNQGGTSGNSGEMTVKSGDTNTGTGSNDSGAASLKSGNAKNNSGHVTVASGSATDGVRGQVILDGAYVNFSGKEAKNAADPTTSQSLVTLSYLNARLLGLKPKAAVRAASTADIDLSVAADPSPVDGVTLADGDRILLKNQTAAAENGIYIAVTAIDPTTWTRATDFDSVSPIDEINGAWVAVQEGSVASGKIYVQFGAVATIGTDAINFEYFNPIASLIGGDMITFSGSTFSVDLATASGLESTNPGNVAGQLRIKLEASNPSLKFTGSNELGVKFDAAGAVLSGASGVAVQVDNSTIEINSNALRVKDAGITLAKLASNSVDENKIVSTAFSATGAVAGGSGTKIAVQVDASSIEINSNALRVKSGAYDQTTITGGSGSAAAVQYAPVVKSTKVAGETMVANTSFAVRMALSGETAGRVYKADQDATSADNFYVVGLALSAGGVSAGQNIDVTMAGSYTLGSSDSPFSSGDIGKPVFLTASGAFSVTAPTTTNYAVVRIGIVETTTKILLQPAQVVGVN